MLKQILLAFLFVGYAISGVVAQDKIIKKDGSVIECKIIKSSPTEVEYQIPNIQQPTLFTLAKSSISVLLFESGYTEVVGSDVTRSKRIARASVDSYTSERISYDFFSLIGREISLQYEKTLSKGMIGLRIPMGYLFNYGSSDSRFTYFLDQNTFYFYEDDIAFGEYYQDKKGGFGLYSGLTSVFYFIPPARFRGYVAPGITLAYFNKKYDIYRNVYDPNDGSYSSYLDRSERTGFGMIGTTVMLGATLKTNDLLSVSFETGGGYGFYLSKNQSNEGTGIWRMSLLLGLNWKKKNVSE